MFVMKSMLVGLALVAATAAYAEDPALPPPQAVGPAVLDARPSALPAGSVAVPTALAQTLLVYLADRSGIAAQLTQSLAQAVQAKPQACPLGDKP